MCLFSLSWYTCDFSTQCHAAGGPSGVPLLADSGWLLYSCGDGFAWGWGLSCHSCPVSPLVFFLCLRSFPFRCFPFGVLPLTEWVGMSVSSLLVYSLVWLEESCCDFFLSACALFSLLQVHGDFLGFSCSAYLLGWLGLCTLCQGVPVAVLSAWFAGGVPLLPFPYLRIGVLLAKVSPEFVGYEGGFGCPSWFFILFRCLLVHLLFLELGWFLVTRWWLLLRLLILVFSDARSHIPDAFASSSTPIYGSWMVLAPGFSCALPWVRPSRFTCWLLARDD